MMNGKKQRHELPKFKEKPKWNWDFFISLGFELIVNKYALFQKLQELDFIDLKTHHKYRVIVSDEYLKIVGKKSVILIYPPRKDRNNALGVRRVPIWELEQDGRTSKQSTKTRKRNY